MHIYIYIYAELCIFSLNVIIPSFLFYSNTLAVLGGYTLKDNVNRVMLYLFSRKSLRRYNWSGKMSHVSTSYKKTFNTCCTSKIIIGKYKYRYIFSRYPVKT